MSEKLFLVVFNDGFGACWPMALDPECDGALETNGGPVALFGSRKAARKAIRISEANARTRQLQGKAVNEDFLPSMRSCIKIREAKCLLEQD